MSVYEKRSRSRVCGFLRAEHGKIINEKGEEILLVGMGLGNWLLQEGYMFRFGGRYNRPRTIEQLVRDLCGTKYAEAFWERFRDNYITEDDVRAMAEAGFNSVRLPINWRVVMEDEPGILFKEDGFARIDRFLDLCEKYGLYVCLDLHGAPGGQTGSNIDDSIDDIPRLLMDKSSDSREKTLALWCEFARRYRDRSIIGMYDLLNEPARTEQPGTPKLPDLREPLKQFYRDCIKEIRKIDKRHMFSIESHYWASQANFFTEVFDENMCAHFHRYWCQPNITQYREFLDVREKLGIALYLGETGENTNEWFSAMYPLGLSLDIGVNVWPWKKMETDSSPCSVKAPKGWDRIIAYTNGGDRPSYEEAQAIFDEYLENIRFANCKWLPRVIASITRSPGCAFRAVDYAASEGISLVKEDGSSAEKWEESSVRFSSGSRAAYLLACDETGGVLTIPGVPEDAVLALSVNGASVPAERKDGNLTAVIAMQGDVTLTLACTSGTAVIDRILWEARV